MVLPKLKRLWFHETLEFQYPKLERGRNHKRIEKPDLDSQDMLENTIRNLKSFLKLSFWRMA